MLRSTSTDLEGGTLMSAKTYLVVAAGLAVLVLAANSVAYATTGHGIVAGIGNSSSKTTGLTMTNSGAALKLTTKKGSPPLVVGSSTKVKNLNADAVDGLDSMRLLNDTYRFGYHKNPGARNAISFTIPTLPAGAYVVNYAVTPYALGSDPTPAAPLQVQCWVDLPGGSAASTTALQINSYYPYLTGSDLVMLGAKDVVHFECQSRAGGMFSLAGLTIAFTQTHVVKSKTLTIDL
jgi:hypothetical protein